MSPSLPVAAFAIILAAVYLGHRSRLRLHLLLAKHPSLAGHPRIAQRLARLTPQYHLDEEHAFRADGAPPDVVSRRAGGFHRLASRLQNRATETVSRSAEIARSLPDAEFTAAYRVPFPFRAVVNRHLRTGVFVRATDGVILEDLDGNRSYDLGGSYGVNVFGYDFYKECVDRGIERTRSLGPVLGPYHPLVHENVKRLCQISGHDEVSFHMSGTEAVMQAVRLARYHTRRSHVVRFCGAYNGWGDDLQPGVGNPRPARETYTLRDMDVRSLRVLRERTDVACVVVNPAQGLHPNANAPADSMLVDSSRRAGFDRPAYTAWLQELLVTCRARGIVFILDEVFVGFRLAPGGAQEYFGLRADLVTYGKTLGGGLPVGVVCGRRDLMRRFKDDRPSDICFARGTFGAHPYVMGAMNEFLRRFLAPETQSVYRNLDETWNRRAASLNQRLRECEVPVRVQNLSSIFTVCYERPSRYNWMLQFYLRVEGLHLSWVGTGRFIFSLDYREADFEAVADRFVKASRTMMQDGFWWAEATATNAALRRQMIREMFGAWVGSFRPSPPRAPESQPRLRRADE